MSDVHTDVDGSGQHAASTRNLAAEEGGRSTGAAEPLLPPSPTATASATFSTSVLTLGGADEKGAIKSESALDLNTERPSRNEYTRRRRLLMIGGALAFLFIVLVVVIPVGVVFGRKGGNSSNGQSSSSSAASAEPKPSQNPSPLGDNITILQGDLTGGDGSTVYPTNGTNATFTYVNKFGGYWSATPFDNSARAQDDSPPLNQSWDFTKNNIRGVNLGGWFTLEPFICSDLFERFMNDTNPAVDEWQLSQKLDAVGPNVKQRVMEDHYSNFITEQDFAQIAGAGLNWVRISFPFWAIEMYPGEPYYKGAWPHFLNAIAWARKYGIRINLDFHALPGSQNGWDHSGRRTFNINWMRHEMGLANAQRSLNYMRVLAEFISQPQYSLCLSLNVSAKALIDSQPVVQMFSIVNEIQVQVVDGYNGTTLEVAKSFYGHAYQMLRSITGPGNGPMIVIHEGFSPITNYYGFLTGADRVVMDTHLYVCFGAEQSTAPINQRYGPTCDNSYAIRNSRREFGMTIGGEWSLAVNDCGYLLNGVGPGYGSRFDGTYAPSPIQQAFGSCDEWDNWQSWTADRKQQFQRLALLWMDSLQNSFFWTWKIRNNLAGQVVNPMWSYSNGLAAGYIPADIRNYTGACHAYDPSYELPCNEQTCPPLPTSASVDIPEWPPTSLVSATTTYYYTPTQTPFSLPVSTPTAYPSGVSVPADAGNGWFNDKDTALFYTPVATSSYPDAWGTVNVPATERILKRSLPTPRPVVQ